MIKVDTSPDPHRAEKYMIEMIQHKQDMGEYIKRYTIAYREATKRINAIKDPKRRLVLEYRGLLGLPWCEVAAKLGCSESYIKNLWEKANEELFEESG
jgi:DNA invertase Pin-like site-specific DNA recombinase